MTDPCKFCPKKGCGSYHDVCQKYQEWKAEREKARQWLRNQAPVVSERQKRYVNHRLRQKARGWYRDRAGGDHE